MSKLSRKADLLMDACHECTTKGVDLLVDTCYMVVTASTLVVLQVW